VVIDLSTQDSIIYESRYDIISIRIICLIKAGSKDYKLELKLFMISDLHFGSNLFIYISLVALILGVIAFLFLILNLLGKTIRSIRGKGTKGISLIQNAFRFTLIVLWILFSAAALFLTAFIESYQSFTKKELVAIVRCTPLDSKMGDMRMELKFVKNGKIEKAQKLIIKGDQWSIEGDILKWDDWLNLLGLHTMYKLTRVRGRYVDTLDEIQHAPTVYGLIENEEDPEWRWLYKYGHELPFVIAVYGNTVFTYPSGERTYEIYVTTSGLMLQVLEK
jgi:uncharacterized protein with PQ loop repeat